MILKKHLFLSALCALLSAGVASAQIVGPVVNTVLSNTDSPNTVIIDLTPGSATFDGAAPELPDTPTPLGDGTVEAYLFVDGENITGTSNVIASSGGIFSPVTIVGLPDDPANGAPTTSGVQTDNLTLTLPDGTLIMGMSPGTDTGHRASNLTGMIDTSSFETGTVYAIFGELGADQAQIVFTTPDGENTVSATIGGGLEGTNPGAPFTFGEPADFDQNGSVISAFSFDNTGPVDNSLLSYNYQCTDVDGSRARFYGFVVDGVVDGVDPGDTLLGDVNLDGEVNFFDISPFIDVLAAQGFQNEADINLDGIVNFFDIAPFITILAGG